MRRRLTGFLLSVVFCFSCLRVPIFAQAPVVYRSVPTSDKRIAITFDDGPHPILTPKILAILERYGVRATFFMVGSNVENYSETALQVVRAGHEIGNHTYSHDRLAGLTEAQLLTELSRCEDALEELCEYRPHLFRPPEGVVNAYVEHCSQRGDYSLILWSIDTRDWEDKNANRIANCVLSQVQPGDIILLHDYIGVKSQTPEALELLLPRLLAQGFQPVTVSELLGYE